MTVSTTDAFVEFTGDGVTVDFIFSFPSFEEVWMFGFVDRVQVPTTVVLNDDQNLNPGGTMTFGAAPADQTDVLVLRIADFFQLTDYPPFTRFPARDHEEALDKLTMITQQLAHAIGVLEGDQTRFVLKSGDTMIGALQTFDVLIAAGDAVNRGFVDNEIQIVQGSSDAGDAALNAGKADKTVELVTNDPDTLIIADPDLSGDITITTRVNSQESLIKTGATGLIPPEHIPPLQGGILTIIGLLDAGVDPTPDPPVVNETGQAYIIIGAGDLQLFLFQDAIEQTVTVEITDNIVWVAEPNVPGLPEGWYFLPLSQVPTIGAAVILDDSLFPYVATNSQEAWDRLFDTHLGTAATEDIQADPLDPTVGTVLVKDAFGLGAVDNVNPPENNLNGIVATGFYRVLDATANLPGGAVQEGSHVFHMNWDTSTAKQMFFNNDANGTTWTRTRISATWNAWSLTIKNGDSPTFGVVNVAELVSSGPVSASFVRLNTGLLEVVNPATPANVGAVRSSVGAGRQGVEILGNISSDANRIEVTGDGDTFPNLITLITASAAKVNITATEPQCIDQGGTLRRMGWSPSKFAHPAGPLALAVLHMGHTIEVSAGSIDVGPNVGADGDLVQLIGIGAFTINAVGGANVQFADGSTFLPPPHSMSAGSVTTLYRQSATSWLCWGNGRT